MAFVEMDFASGGSAEPTFVASGRITLTYSTGGKIPSVTINKNGSVIHTDENNGTISFTQNPQFTKFKYKVVSLGSSYVAGIQGETLKTYNQIMSDYEEIEIPSTGVKCYLYSGSGLGQSIGIDFELK